MTVNEVCAYFDRYEIVDTQIEIDREYYSAMGESSIYTDGEFKCNVNRDGYIHITSVQNASYIIFVDREYKTCLCIYKHIPDITCKYIIENLHLLQNKINTYMIKDSNEEIPIIENHNIESDIIDINAFTCTECDCKKKLNFIRSKDNIDVLKTKCDNCKTEYEFVPSKYYKLSSKRVVYFKSEETSRNITII